MSSQRIKGWRRAVSAASRLAAGRTIAPREGESVVFRSEVRVSSEWYLCRPSAEKDPIGNEFARTRNYPRDGDNASLKATVDGLRDGLIIADDTARHVTILPPRLYSRAKEHQGRAALVLTIEEVAEDA